MTEYEALKRSRLIGACERWYTTKTGKGRRVTKFKSGYTVVEHLDCIGYAREVTDQQMDGFEDWAPIYANHISQPYP
jgi:hypothetical protein